MLPNAQNLDKKKLPSSGLQVASNLPGYCAAPPPYHLGIMSEFSRENSDMPPSRTLGNR